MEGIKISFEAMKAYQNKLDITANNISNVSTNGYKKIEGIFTEKEDGGIDIKNAVNKKSGSLIPTFSHRDIALEKDGFFAVEDENKNVFYTKNGSFNIDRNGNLINSQGFYLLSDSGRVKVDNQSKVEIDSEGNVIENGKKSVKLKMVSLNKNSDIIYKGNGVYQTGSEPETYSGKVIKGHSESSNVNPVEEMSEMIRIMRNFERLGNFINQDNIITSKMINTFSKF